MAILCAATLLASAFLLFSIQPMAAKMMLPILGGSPSVWNTAMVFYQGALLLGYFYAHFIAKRLSVKAQTITHSLLLAVPLIVLPLYFRDDLRPPFGVNPIGWMLGTMALSVGLPFFVLSASSPLVQSWFSRTGGANPYGLYAASNVGSFLGLLAYPFLIEPLLSVNTQSTAWALGYVVVIALLVILGIRVRKAAPIAADVPEETESLAPWRKLRWLFLAFVPSSHFMGVTTFLTTDIAVMPMLWVIPLAIYLLSMVLVFANRPPIPHAWVKASFPFVLAGLIFVTLCAKKLGFPIPLTFGIHLLALFAGAMLCHGELAADRPKPGRLTEFFMWMSLGGVLGGVFNALVAPLVFVQVIEYSLILVLLGFALPARVAGWKPSLAFLDIAAPVGILGSVVGLMWLQMNYGMTSNSKVMPFLIGIGCLAAIVCAARPLRFGLAIGAMILVGVYGTQSPRKAIFTGRSFFGVHRVEMIGDSHSFLNGRILHGKQFFNEAEKTPLTYYHFNGPLKELFEHRPANATVGVVGLGIGSMALWSKPGERWTYYEIDPIVEKLARNPSFFTCLAAAPASINVAIGDARLRLQEPAERYDILVIDAFSSDAIPAHLLTKEAFALYRRRLKPNGMLAIHVTNKYLDLEPLVAALAEEMGWESRICIENAGDFTGDPGRSPSDWAVCGTKNADWHAFEESVRWQKLKSDPAVKAWTDDYSSLMPIFKRSALSSL